VAQSNETLKVQWEKKLPIGPKYDYILTNHQCVSVVDTSLHWAYSTLNESDGPCSIKEHGVPTVVHLHGGHTDAEYDGTPEQFFSPDFAITGATFESKTYYYDNSQSASLLWYHDHTLGITRLNTYAGMAGLYVVRDELDTGKADNKNKYDLNDPPMEMPCGDYELGIAIQDRLFKQDGSFFFPSFPGDPYYSGYIDDEGVYLPNNIFPNGGPTIFKEFFGNVMLVNGVAWPAKDEVPRAPHRLRILNGCDSRFLIVEFEQVVADAVDVATSNTQPQVLLDFALVTDPSTVRQTLVIAPGQRVDLLVDFSAVEDDKHVIMRNSGSDEPFGGDPVTSPADIPERVETFGRMDRIMLFKVVAGLVTPATFPTTTMAPSSEHMVDRTRVLATFENPDRTRALGLFEGRDVYNRLMPLLGTSELATDETATKTISWDKDQISRVPQLDGPMEGTMTWSNPTTEIAKCGDIENWEIWNVSPDAHPIHVHLIQFVVVERQTILWNKVVDVSGDDPHICPADPADSDGTCLEQQAVVMHDGAVASGYKIVNKTTDPTPVSKDSYGQYGEVGESDIVIANPNEVTTIQMKFDKVGRYVWHCHILSHEDNEMMRVIEVLPTSKRCGKDKGDSKSAKSKRSDKSKSSENDNGGKGKGSDKSSIVPGKTAVKSPKSEVMTLGGSVQMYYFGVPLIE
jgi:spore coat protein A